MVLLLHHEAHEAHEEHEEHEEHEGWKSSWPSCASWSLLKVIDAAQGKHGAPYCELCVTPVI